MTPSPAPASPVYAPPSSRRAAWLIARRAALESLRDRTTLSLNVFFAFLLPLLIVMTAVRPQAHAAVRPADLTALGTVMTVYLLVVALIPSSGAINIAAGVFAGEKEKGNLAPLLATPASNAAIFGGKVLGAVTPALVYAVVAVAVYILGVFVLVGGSFLSLMPAASVATMLLLAPLVAILGASVAAIASSKVRTYNAAQMLTSLLLFPLMGALFAVAFKLPGWGAVAGAVVVAIVAAVDVLVVVVGAATWRRDEVLATL